MARNGQLIIEDAKIVYKHFSGIADDFHREGDRDFSIRIEDEDLAERLRADGWNIKEKVNPDDDSKYWHMKVKVSYRYQAPTVAIVKKDGEVFLNENTVGTLDHAEIVKADVIIDPSVWSVRGETGITGYLRALHVRILEDPFAERYRNGYAALEADATGNDNPF